MILIYSAGVEAAEMIVSAPDLYTVMLEFDKLNGTFLNGYVVDDVSVNGDSVGGVTTHWIDRVTDTLLVKAPFGRQTAKTTRAIR